MSTSENQLRPFFPPPTKKFKPKKTKQPERSCREEKEKLIRFCRMTEMELMSKNCRLDFIRWRKERERELSRNNNAMLSRPFSLCISIYVSKLVLFCFPDSLWSPSDGSKQFPRGRERESQDSGRERERDI
jgi:hypothetical protein